MDELKSHIADVEDHLFPGLELDAWQKVLYHHLLRHTRLVGKSTALFAIAPLATATGMSDFKVRDAIRSMHHKGCIQIEERNRKGHLLRVLLPCEIPGIIPEEEEKAPVDLDTLDVFSNRRYLRALLAREDDRCFYCLRQVDADACELDHVAPQAERLDNTFRNIVVACHECNTTKQETPASDFVRSLYRSGLLSQEEVQNRLAAIKQLQAGELIPEM